jgi:putative transposase
MTKRKIAEPDLIDRLLADYQKPEDLIGENGILKQLTKAVAADRKLTHFQGFC